MKMKKAVYPRLKKDFKQICIGYVLQWGFNLGSTIFEKEKNLNQNILFVGFGRSAL